MQSSKLRKSSSTGLEESCRVSLTCLGQAGFLLKGSGLSIAIDPYLSDCVEREVGFKRMLPAIITAEELKADLLLSTHSHLDHLDIDALPVFAARPAMRFIGARDCEAVYKASGIAESRYKVLREGESSTIGNARIRAVHADHGELAPEAVGFLIEMDGLAIYNVGDSCLATERILESLGGAEVDLMIAPINGAFGNMDAMEACALAAGIRPKCLIGCHFGMFVEQGGNPAEFLAESKRLGLDGLVMASGETLCIGCEDNHG